jgi:2-phospho-L-lactate guanylyltransferase
MTLGSKWAIVPVKSLAEVKQRLASELPLEIRRQLMLVMLQDVLATLQSVETMGPILVVSPDAQVADLAERRGVLLLREARGTGHSAAVASGLAFAKSRGAARAIALPADVPLVTAEEIRRVIDAETPGVTLVPSRDGDGTNAILFDPPGALAPSFGPGSFARHQAQAAERGIACPILQLPGLALDIDASDDLAQLMRRTRSLPRYAFLAQHDPLPAGAEP